ncbi:hypothetical protein AVEN_117776-1 [Araneus ventricosus]|uniref:Uncharacterized protein n=1 Tax=Araneus ventricosus TaxID=182803 RepID=A0A4Y2BA36_ARAVE|nr:hypothetical protein AVEN_117776-1 [Araneus ventricosus]
MKDRPIRQVPYSSKRKRIKKSASSLLCEIYDSEMKLQKRKKKPPYSHLSQNQYHYKGRQFLPSPGVSKPAKYLNEFCDEFSRRDTLVNAPKICGETSVNDRKFKGSGQNAFLGGYSTTAV